MTTGYDLVTELTSATLPRDRSAELMSAFAHEFGWQPSDSITDGQFAVHANGHLLVEHGLENTAAITFLRHPVRYEDLERDARLRLLGLSYNNLVDWHVQVESGSVTYVFNRAPLPGVVETRRIARDDTGALASDRLVLLSAKPPRPSFPALDEAFVEAISYWKRRLAAELEFGVENRTLSKLFNMLILVRAIEDQLRVADAQPTSHRLQQQILLREWEQRTHSSLRSLIGTCMEKLSGVGYVPAFDPAELAAFDILSHRTVASLLSDFYKDRRVPYWYDFSLMSKHALSRIYEHYVSLLAIEDAEQLALFPQLPEEERNRAFGSIYTPQFIARFFAKLAIREMPEEEIRSARIMDPACGSGIFLRTFLEQADLPVSRATGIDFDGNACQAARLSLSLLGLSRTGELPQDVNVIEAESLGYFADHPELTDSCDLVMMNPPFLSLERLEPRMRQRTRTYLGDLKRGRIDAYLPFLKLSVDALRPGGLAFVVVPHSFLLAENASKVRRFLAEECELVCVADLSAIRVFGQTGSYIVLLAFRKRARNTRGDSPATIVLCQDFPSRALQDALEGRWRSTPSYRVFRGSQRLFRNGKWLLLAPEEMAIRRRLEYLPTLGDFLEIHQGFVSGADDVFILSESVVPVEERTLFVPYLADRQMQSYAPPAKTEEVFFYPYLEGEKVSEDEIRSGFPWTWKHLTRNRNRLQARAGLDRYNKAWWEPLWPRKPSSMLRPKIVSPHLTLTPRFLLDSEGKYSVSRSPMLYPAADSTEDEMGVLYYFLGILNSAPCFWSISLNSHVYRGGYLMLERKTLLSIPVPDPVRVDSSVFRRLIVLVQRRIDRGGETGSTLEEEIDLLASSLYGLSRSDLEALGLSPRA